MGDDQQTLLPPTDQTYHFGYEGADPDASAREYSTPTFN
jgi:hypothetical protein